MTTGSSLYLAFCLSILVGLAWADWRGWAPRNCEDQFTAEWTQAADLPFSECVIPSSGGSNSRNRSLRSRHYQGGK